VCVFVNESATTSAVAQFYQRGELSLGMEHIIKHIQVSWRYRLTHMAQSNNRSINHTQTLESRQ